MLSGRKPPFRLLVKAVHLRGAPINIRHAVSEGFVVATRRTRTAGKVRAAVYSSCAQGFVTAPSCRVCLVHTTRMCANSQLWGF